MTSIAKLLKETIEHTAKKQARSETEALRKASVRYRKTIADLSTRVKKMERDLAAIRRQIASASPGAAQQEPGNLRFSAKGLQSLRNKLGISKTEYGRLLGVSGRTIGSWESGLARPTAEQIRDIAGIRNLGKREVRSRFEEKAQDKK
jgi:DNA-binding transcriptional regulator YiaG